MMFNRRIFETGVLAAVTTIAFAIFANQVAKWSSEVSSEGAGVAGQTSTANPCAAGATAQTVKVIPQIALGSFDGGKTTYSTVIQIVNTSGGEQTISANFFKPDGTPLDNLSLTAGASTISNGVLPESPIVKDGLLVIGGAGTRAPGMLGWGKITACGDLSVAIFFELRDGETGSLYSRVGVEASPSDMSAFVIPRVREPKTGLDVGFALVNTGPSEATVRAELKGPSGNTIAAKDIVMAAGTHQSTLTNQLFAGLTESAGRSYQYLKFSSGSPAFAALALAFEGPTQASLPVARLE